MKDLFVRKNQRVIRSNFLFKNYTNFGDIKHLAASTPPQVMDAYPDSMNRLRKIIEKNGGKFFYVGHHESHAANAFFSSNFNDAIILTLDGGGVESDGFETACTIWKGDGNKIKLLDRLSMRQFNIGGMWTRATRLYFQATVWMATRSPGRYRYGYVRLWRLYEICG